MVATCGYSGISTYIHIYIYIYIRHGLLTTKLSGADLEARWFPVFTAPGGTHFGWGHGFLSQPATFSPFQQHFRLIRPALVSWYPRITALWVCLKMLCTPFYPMVLLIIIPILNGYFIGNIPYFQTNPYECWETLATDISRSSIAPYLSWISSQP